MVLNLQISKYHFYTEKQRVLFLFCRERESIVKMDLNEHNNRNISNNNSQQIMNRVHSFLLLLSPYYSSLFLMYALLMNCDNSCPYNNRKHTREKKNTRHKFQQQKNRNTPKKHRQIIAKRTPKRRISAKLTIAPHLIYYYYYYYCCCCCC